MEITPDAARESLAHVQGTAEQFRRAVVRNGTDWIFGYYNLWMAVAGGGALLGSGIYIRIAWR